MNKEIENILERSGDCLSDAKFNFQHSRYMAAVNRSYYSVFDCLVALLLTHNVYTKTHQGAHLKFNELFVKSGLFDAKFSQMLMYLFDLRQSVDYDFQFEPSEQDAGIAVEYAELFLNATRDFLHK